MYRIRFHGRGGQGIKTASRVLGSALFGEGFEVQDAPRYGAERRGAPIFAYVRAAKEPIRERGAMDLPDLVVVADDTLVGVPQAGVLQGLDRHSVLLIDSAVSPEDWRDRLAFEGRIVVLPTPGKGHESDLKFVGAACAGAAARLLGVVGRTALATALETEYAAFGAGMAARNLRIGLDAYDAVAESEAIVTQRVVADPKDEPAPGWIDVPREAADISAPAIHAPLTSVQVRTGLWRTLRPVIDYDRCRRCWWVCSTFCPDDAISVSEDGRPVIDYDHCKGCMICVAQCPPHAIEAIAETEARAAEEVSA